jgi:hypothetical protein
MADVFVSTGRPDEATALMTDAMRLIHHPPGIGWNWGAHFVAGDTQGDRRNQAPSNM